MLRPAHAARWKRVLQHVLGAGAEPRHTRQGCRHPCVSAASRLAQPFCTRPPDLFGSVLLDVLLLVSLRPECLQGEITARPPVVPAVSMATSPSTLQHYVYQRLDVAFSNFSKVGQHSDVQAWFTQMIQLRRQFYADSKFSLDPSALPTSHICVPPQLLSTPPSNMLTPMAIKSITVHKVRHRNGPASHTSSAEVLSANVARGRSPGPVRRHACTHCPVHCPARPGAASHPRRSDKSPSVYSASSASPRYLHDDDFDTEATIAALQARVNSLESQQQAQHLTIQSAFFQDPPVDSDQD